MDMGPGGIGPKIKVLQNTRQICLFYSKFNEQYFYINIFHVMEICVDVNSSKKKLFYSKMT